MTRIGPIPAFATRRRTATRWPRTPMPTHKPRLVKRQCCRAKRVRWAGLTWTGTPFPIRLFLYLRDGDGDPREFVARFPGCGCVRSFKAAWLRLIRRRGVTHGPRQID